MTNLDNILKNRDIAWATKVHLVKAIVFPVVMYACESDYKESWRIYTFELCCWRRLLRIPWTARKSKQSILKEISPEYSLEGLMLKLKLQYFGHLMWSANYWKRPWYHERLKAGGEGDNRGWDGWMASLTRGTWVWVSSGEGQGSLVCCSPRGRTRLSNWTELSDRRRVHGCHGSGRRGWGVAVNGHGDSFLGWWGVLELHSGDVCITLWIYQKAVYFAF